MQSLSQQLKAARIKSGLTLQGLAHKTGYSLSLVHAIEKARRRPSSRYIEVVAAACNSAPIVDQGPPPRNVRKGRRIYGSLGTEIRQAFAFQRPRRQLPRFEVAYNSATSYPLGRALMATVVAKKSPHYHRWEGLKLMAGLMNGAEQLATLHLLAHEAEVECVSPARLGFHLSVLTLPDRPPLALVFVTPDAAFAIFPQLGIEVSRGHLRYADFLVAVSVAGERHYVDVEIDGPGHDRISDQERDESLARVRVPTLRFPLAALDRPDFAAHMLASCITAACPG